VKIGVAATAPIGADVLERLAESYDVQFLLTRPDAPSGRGRKLAPPPAKIVAERLGIPVHQPAKPELPGEVDRVVVCAYGLYIPPRLLERSLWLNVHPSLLPRWRGAAPVERTLLAGDAETGVTIHETVKELDAGPIAAQERFTLADEDDAGSVFARTAELAVELLDRVLPDPVFTPQPADGVTYAEKITPEDRVLHWTDAPTTSLNRIRALSPHIGARGTAAGRPVIVWRARLATGDAKLVEGGLELLEVQPEGKGRMSGAAFLNGLR